MKNICIVGCGAIAEVHAKNLSPFANLFFYSRSRSSAENLQQKFQGKGIFESFDEVLSSSEIDAIAITSPPDCHAEQIIQALSRGKSVLVEKPMCISRSQIQDIEIAVKNSPDVFLIVAENYYYKPSVKKIKELLAAGYLGKIKSVSVQKIFEQEATGWKSSYGALLEGGIHFVALISDIFDAVPQRVEAEFPDREKGKPERFAIARLTYPNHAEAQLRYAWNVKSWGKGLFQHSVIVGESGKINFESNGIYMWIDSEKKKGVYLPDLGDLMGYQAMTQDFISCLETPGKKPYSSFEKAKRDLEIVFSAYDNLPV